MGAKLSLIESLVDETGWQKIFGKMVRWFGNTHTRFFAEFSEKTDAALVVCTDKNQPTASSQLASMILFVLAS